MGIVEPAFLETAQKIPIEEIEQAERTFSSLYQLFKQYRDTPVAGSYISDWMNDPDFEEIPNGVAHARTMTAAALSIPDEDTGFLLSSTQLIAWPYMASVAKYMQFNDFETPPHLAVLLGNAKAPFARDAEFFPFHFFKNYLWVDAGLIQVDMDIAHSVLMEDEAEKLMLRNCMLFGAACREQGTSPIVMAEIYHTNLSASYTGRAKHERRRRID